MRQVNFDVSDMPTIKAFLECDAFIQGLMGPFGCLAGDAEFLTPTGWKRMDAYAEGDRVAVWHPEWSRPIWTVPRGYIDAPCETLLLFASGSLKMALSPEHRVPHWNWAGDFQVKTAAEIALHPSSRTVPTSFEAPGAGVDMSDDLIRFAVMMHADGWYPPEGRHAIVEVHKDRKKARLRQLLSALGVAWVERARSDRPDALIFAFEPPYAGKHYGGAWYACSGRQLRIVLDEIEHWDGLHGTGETRFFTTDKGDADFIQFAAHATGRRATIREQARLDPDWARQFVVYVTQPGSRRGRATIRAHTEISLIPAPGGRKYCFETETGFFIARYRDTVFVTGNSAKSSGCIWKIIKKGLQQAPGPDGVRRSRWAVIRNTYPMLRDTTIRTVHQWFPFPTFGRWRATEHDYIINAFCAPGDTVPAQIELMFRALDRPDHVKNLLSLDLTGAWVNEAREVPWAIIEALQGRVDRYPAKRDGGATWAGVIMDTNPPDTDSAWFKFFEESDHSEAVAQLAEFIPGLTVEQYARIFKQPSGLGPSAENKKNQSPGYWHRLAIGKSPEWVKVYCAGEYGFVVDGRPVFPEYHDTIHCPGDADPKRAPVTDRRLPIHRGWDFGLTPACVFSQLNARGQWIVVDEIVSTRMGVDRLSDEVLRHSGEHFPDSEFIDTGDPAGEQPAQTDERTCFDILHAKGIAIEGGLQSPQIRFESVRRPLRQMDDDGSPAFNIHPRCRVTRRAFMGGYHFRKVQIAGTERYAEKPEKNAYSHPIEGLCYTATRLFGPSLQYRQQQLDGDLVELESRLVTDRSRSAITGY